jgi:hypothetical protein
MITTPTNTQKLLAMAKAANAKHVTPESAAEFRIAVERRLIQIGTDTLDAVVSKQRSYVVAVYLAPDQILPKPLRKWKGKTLLLSDGTSRAVAANRLRNAKMGWKLHRYISLSAQVLTDVQCITTKGRKP